MPTSTILTIALIVVLIVSLIAIMYISGRTRNKKIEKNTAKLEQKGFTPTSGVTFEPYRFLVDKNAEQWCITDLVTETSDFKLFSFHIVKDALFLEGEETVLKASEIEFPIFDIGRKDTALKLKTEEELYQDPAVKPELEKVVDKEGIDVTPSEETEGKEGDSAVPQPKSKRDYEAIQAQIKYQKEQKQKELERDPSFKTNPFKTPIPKEGTVENMKIKVILDIEGQEKAMTIQLAEKKIKRSQALYTDLYKGSFKIVNQFAYILKKSQG